MAKKTDKEIIEVLRSTLQAASDHLDYCGYGDAWERECSEGLEERIKAALSLAKAT